MSEWVEKAETFLSEARGARDRGIYWLACFEAHQAAELYLEALLVERTGLYPFTHDLLLLLDEVSRLGIEVPEEVYKAADLLTPHYIMSRYPRRRAIEYNERRGRACVEAAEKIIGWARGVVRK